MNIPLIKIEHPENSGILIRQKPNASGTNVYGTSFQVDVPQKVTQTGRIRKQFKTLEEAKSWAEQQVEGKSIYGRDYFNVSDRERHDFIAALHKIRDTGLTLEECVDFTLPRLRPEGGLKTVSEIVNEILQSKESALEKGHLRPLSVRAFKTRSDQILEEFGDTCITDLGMNEIKEWTAITTKAPRTIQNYLVCLSEILSYSVRKKYAAENFLDNLSKTERREIYGVQQEIEPEILDIEEARRLLTAAFEHQELGMSGVVVLGLFCGLRTEELKRLDWGAVRITEQYVTVSAEIAKKRRIRNTMIPDNAVRWLKLINEREGPVFPHEGDSNYYHNFERLLRKSGFIVKEQADAKTTKEKSLWKKNAMRHSFGSYHFALHGNSILTSNELGHRQGDQVLFDHYRALATKEDAERYFGINPDQSYLGN